MKNFNSMMATVLFVCAIALAVFFCLGGCSETPPAKEEIKKVEVTATANPVEEMKTKSK